MLPIHDGRECLTSEAMIPLPGRWSCVTCPDAPQTTPESMHMLCVSMVVLQAVLLNQVPVPLVFAKRVVRQRASDAGSASPKIKKVKMVKHCSIY